MRLSIIESGRYMMTNRYKIIVTLPDFKDPETGKLGYHEEELVKTKKDVEGYLQRIHNLYTEYHDKGMSFRCILVVKDLETDKIIDDRVYMKAVDPSEL